MSESRPGTEFVEAPSDDVIAAERALRRGALDEARHLLAGRQDARALVLLGVVALRAGDVQESKAVLANAASLAPHDAVAHAYSALALVLAGDVAEARSALGRALELAPDRFIVHVIHAQYWYRLGCYDEAMRLARAAMAVGAPDQEQYAFAAALLREARERARGTFVRGVRRGGGSGWWRRGRTTGAKGQEALKTAWA